MEIDVRLIALESTTEPALNDHHVHALQVPDACTVSALLQRLNLAVDAHAVLLNSRALPAPERGRALQHRDQVTVFPAIHGGT